VAHAEPAAEIEKAGAPPKPLEEREDALEREHALVRPREL